MHNVPNDRGDGCYISLRGRYAWTGYMRVTVCDRYNMGDRAVGENTVSRRGASRLPQTLVDHLEVCHAAPADLEPLDAPVLSSLPTSLHRAHCRRRRRPRWRWRCWPLAELEPRFASGRDSDAAALLSWPTGTDPADKLAPDLDPLASAPAGRTRSGTGPGPVT